MGQHGKERRIGATTTLSRRIARGDGGWCRLGTVDLNDVGRTYIRTAVCTNTLLDMI
jgi:hypothetical protein